MEARSYLQILPREINSKVFSYLSLRTVIGRLARASKTTATLVQDVLSGDQAAHNSLNILVTGLPGAGSTTLYSRLSTELDLSSLISNLSISNDTTALLKLVNDNVYQIKGIQLQYTRASIWHGATEKNQVKMMYANCGACQAIVYVIPCGGIEQVKARLRQDLITYHALTVDVEWIFVVNKMDLASYNEQEYNKCVDGIKKVAVQVIGEHRLDRMHFIPMSANDLSIRVTSDINANMVWQKSDTSLWSVLNHVAKERGGPSIYKLFREFKASVVRYYSDISYNGTFIVGVYIIDGCVSVGDKHLILPYSMTKKPYYAGYYYPFYNGKYTNLAEVVGIQSNHNARSIALPNSYVTLALTAIQKPPLRKFHFVQHPPATPAPPSSSINNQFHAVVLHVGDILPEYKWNGLISEGFSGAIHSLGIRGSVTIVRIITVWDKSGNKIDLQQLKEERKCLAFKKGEKAEVLLEPHQPVEALNLTIRNNSNDDACGRFVLMTQKSHVVVVGCVDRGANAEDRQLLANCTTK